MRSKLKPTVVRCCPRQDGGWLVVMSDGKSGSSPRELVIGQRAEITGGAVVFGSSATQTDNSVPGMRP